MITPTTAGLDIATRKQGNRTRAHGV
ncbi:MAG: hypothetical protein K0R41_2079, partial [Geminicoccaceae bacterium]|nr:hypothetical protein [Geminicoccaceae bacterium]